MQYDATCIELIVAKRQQIVTQTCVNINSGNGFLPDGNTPLREPMLTSH